jgi:DNA-binding NarL/FixJ family response regulator
MTMLSMLSSREREIVLLIVEGRSNKEIARQLKLADRTVKVHLHNIYLKLAIRNRTMLAVLAAKLQAQDAQSISLEKTNQRGSCNATTSPWRS